MEHCSFAEAARKLAERYAPALARNGNRGAPRHATTPRPLSREELERDGWRQVEEYRMGDRLRKVRFEHPDRLQEEKERPEKTFAGNTRRLTEAGSPVKEDGRTPLTSTSRSGIAIWWSQPSVWSRKGARIPSEDSDFRHSPSKNSLRRMRLSLRASISEFSATRTSRADSWHERLSRRYGHTRVAWPSLSLLPIGPTQVICMMPLPIMGGMKAVFAHCWPPPYWGYPRIRRLGRRMPGPRRILRTVACPISVPPIGNCAT